MTSNFTAAIIARVSTQTQNFDRQIEELQQLSQKMGYKVKESEIYAEKISGFTKADDRKELNRLISDIKGGKKIDMIFCSEISRIAREPRLGHAFIEQMIDFKVPVYVQNMNMASMNPDGTRNSMFFIIIGILLEFARSEAEYTKMRMKSGKKQNFKEGRNIGGEFVLFGYMRDEKDSDYKAAKLIINEGEAKWVRKMFELYLAGNGCKVIANYFNKHNVPTRTGVKWSLGQIYQSLNRITYTGARYFKDELFEGVVPAIIDKETWDKVQKVMTERNINPIREVKYLYLLKEKLFCGYCGSKYQAKFKEGKHSHYMCFQRFKGQNCEAGGIGIYMIESLAWFITKHSVFVYDYLKENNEVIKNAEINIKKFELQLSTYSDELKEKTEEKKKWNRLFVLGHLSESELGKELEKIDRTTVNLDHKIFNIQNELNANRELIVKADTVNNYKAIIKDIGVDRVKIKGIIDNVIDKMVITSVNINEFIISAYMYGQTFPHITVLFNKKTMTAYTNPKGNLLATYDERGVFTGNKERMIEVLKSDSYTVNYKGKSKKFTSLPVQVETVPFTRLNILKENTEVKLKPKAKMTC